MAARRVWAWAHVLRALAGEEMPLTRDTAGARHSGMPGGRTLLPRKACLRRAAKMRQHALRGRANPPCPEAPAPKGSAVLLVQGLPPRGLWPILHLPAQPARAEGREGGLLDTICLPWLARSAVARPRGWLAGIRLYISAAAAAWRARGQRRRTAGAGAATVCAALA